jgi:hypothetical protein
MRTQVTALTVLAFSVACEPADAPDVLESETISDAEVQAVDQGRAVRNPGFPFIDVDGDEKYDEEIDQVASLDTDGELVTAYSLVVPYDKWNPGLWHDEQVSITVGGDLVLDGEISCLTSCIGSGCLSGSDTCSVDIDVTGDITTSSRSEIHAVSGMGAASVSISAGGDIDLKSVEITAVETYPSTDDGSIIIEAEGDLEAPAMDALVDMGGSSLVVLSTAKQFLSVNKVDVSADTVELETCRSAAGTCSYIPVVDLRKFQVDSTIASLCLDGEDITAGSTSWVTTNAKTSANLCH